MREIVTVSILLIAAIWDYKKQRIPNVLIVAGWISAVVFSVWKTEEISIRDFVLGMLLPIVIVFPFFIMKAIGAGDIKLFSMIGSINGIYILAKLVAVFAVITVICCVGMLVIHNSVRQRLRMAFYYFCSGNFIKKAYYADEEKEAQLKISLAPIILISYMLLLIERWLG